MALMTMSLLFYTAGAVGIKQRLKRAEEEQRASGAASSHDEAQSSEQPRGGYGGALSGRPRAWRVHHRWMRLGPLHVSCGVIGAKERCRLLNFNRWRTRRHSKVPKVSNHWRRQALMEGTPKTYLGHCAAYSVSRKERLPLIGSSCQQPKGARRRTP